jgi:hypothetical protein
VGPEALSQYCREVEDHLTRVNGGHLVRIVGAGFELVRQWAEAGIPLSVVYRAIEIKADRHHTGSARRPLRIEFCESDVRTIYDGWRRAVGLPRGDAASGTDGADSHPVEEQPKRPSLTKHLDRAIDRLGRVAGRLELPEAFLDAIGEVLQELVALRAVSKGARGADRDELTSRLAPIDTRMIDAARTAAGLDGLRELDALAADDLAAFRHRLSGEAWCQAVAATVDRLLRDRYGLPTLTL